MICVDAFCVCYVRRKKQCARVGQVLFYTYYTNCIMTCTLGAINELLIEEKIRNFITNWLTRCYVLNN